MALLLNAAAAAALSYAGLVLLPRLASHVAADADALHSELLAGVEARRGLLRRAEGRLRAVAWQRLFLLGRCALGKPKRTLRRRAVLPDASG